MHFASIRFYVGYDSEDKPYIYDERFYFKLSPEFDTDTMKEILKKELLAGIQPIVDSHNHKPRNLYGFFIEATDEGLKEKFVG